MRSLLVSLLAGCALAFGALPATAAGGGSERIRDLATVAGVRVNQLIGYGVVVGLDGSGDAATQVQFTGQSVQSLLSQFGVTLPPGVTPQMKNVAAVMVTAALPAYAQPGQQIDITVSSLGNARSLRGGTLLLTPLRGADSQVYAMAQGNLVIGGAGAAAGGSKVAINHLLAGRIPGGATVERAVANAALESDVIHLELNQTDFSTARLVAEAINRHLGGEQAQPLDARVVQVRFPGQGSRVRFIAELENLEVALAAPPARVIVNARTGSVVINQSVRLGASAVAHGSLSVTVSSTPVVSQPAPLSGGQTVVTEKADIRIQQGSGALMEVPASADLAEVVKALNALGASAQDLIGILQAMKAAGALKADLEII
ncbi:flagellar basal body P-ring protein FlgI [Ramlibacter alkalitolerans]|uniref:Flagellar P-ring protein n=1 Tax=Ramlibacter alkalitolerans TaxID=2039631 RepID=A0ABS1JKY0_9BURK|nr:flagellar basal body P-ring protein FlgI [Ramlibacter alkalitolerans]MBL0424854.1 flagellar basal body P-ring protein FlgI [Ramlibacter alkalitolerans]